MKRTFLGAATVLSLVLAAASARAQAPLLVGSVRDQHGRPIPGARVAGTASGGAGPSTTTDASGTFALHAAAIVSVTVSCRYCQTAVFAVTPEQPVVAIVRRYDALLDDSPSQSDLDSLPYAHVESSIALRPFTLLAQTTTAYPGSRLSDRGLSASGSLLIDDNVPAYDSVSGESPYSLVPARYEQSAAVRDASNAYAYGDEAGGGIVDLTPFAAGSNPEIALVGNDAIARAQVGSDAAGVAIASFSNDEESRQRGDVFATWPLGGGESLGFSGGSEQGRQYESPGSQFAGSFSFANASFSDARLENVTVSAETDRGNYALQAGEYPISSGWSDSSFAAGVRSNGTFFGFADVGLRTTSGFYDAQALLYGPPRLGVTLTQTRADAGFSANGADYAITGGVGAFWFDYAGGTYGYSWPVKTALAVPSLDARLFPNGKWSLDLQGSGSFTLPTFTEQYLYSNAVTVPVQYQRNSLYAGSLTYTDTSRLRFSFEQASEEVTGAASGQVTSSGVSAIWQIAPVLSLRAWTMHVTDTVPVYGTVPAYGGEAPTANAFWMTYDVAGGVRADAIYRRDLLDSTPFYHVDGAISGPVANGLRWYAGVEDRMRRTFIDIGMRFDAR